MSKAVIARATAARTRILDALHPHPPDSEDTDGATKNDDSTKENGVKENAGAENKKLRVASLQMLEGIVFKLLVSTRQEATTTAAWHGSVKSTQIVSMVSATLGKDKATRQQVLICFTTQFRPTVAVWETSSQQAVHVLNVTDKGRYQPVITAGYGPSTYHMLREMTQAGAQGLLKLFSSSGVCTRWADGQAIALLLVGARAQVDAELGLELGLRTRAQVEAEPEPMITGAGPSAPAAATPERVELGVFAKHVQAMLSTCKPGTFGQGKQHAIEGISKTAPVGAGVSLLLWTTSEKNESGKGSKVTDATKRLLAAIETLTPKAKAVPRKQGFKMAAEVVEAKARDVDAGWQGSCGLVDIVGSCVRTHVLPAHKYLARPSSRRAQISPDELVMVLKFADQHTRAVWTELVCKSFRLLRAEPALFATLRLCDRARGGSATNICGSLICADVKAVLPGPWKCPAQHWANVIASKASCLTALDLSGNHKAPLTAIKACLRAVPSSLKSLNLDGVNSANRGTLKEIARLTKLESLSLNCGHPKDGFNDGGDGVIQLVKLLPHLQLLRVQPFTAFGSFLGNWDFVASCKIWKPEYLEECLEEDQDPYPDTSRSGFEDESAQWSYVSRAVRLGQNKLAQLQQALPRRCRLTNSGHHRGLIKPWGEAATELPAWHVWMADLYKDMDGGRALRGTSYLQCGPCESSEPRRFKSYEDWLAKNPQLEELKPLGPVIQV